MSKVELQFTYDTATPTSAEHGDTSEHGFYSEGREYPIGGCEIDPADCYAFADCPDPEVCTAREALRDIRDTCGALDSVQAWGGELTCYAADSDEDYRTGAHTRYAAHVKGHPRVIAALARMLDR